MRAADRPRPRTHGESGEIVSLSERMGYMQILRLGIALVVLASGAFASEIVGASFSELVIVTGAYLAITGLREILRKVLDDTKANLRAGNLLLLVDGIYLAWAMYSTGASASPLRFLVYTHLISVTLLAAYRTGLKIALWHSLLFFVVFYAQAAGILDPVDDASRALAEGGGLGQSSIFNVMAFWVVALSTTAFSSVNERELRRRKVDLEALADMGAEFDHTTDPSSIAQILLDKVADTFGFDRGVVLAAPEGGLRVMAYKGPENPPAVLPGLDALVRRAWDERTPVLVKTVDPGPNPQLASALEGARNVVIIPLFAEGQPLGALAVENHGGRGGYIERRVVTMVTQFASHAALALQSAWLLAQVQKMADTDALTGVANRRTFEHVLEQEISRASRNRERLSVLMVDIDHFKALNDTHGHIVGDEALRQVADALETHSRDFDTTARYGGEEFVVVLPSCPEGEALVVAERLRRAVAELDTVQPITVSAGAATFPLHAEDGASLVEAADAALYESKRSGRNRVTLAKPAKGALVEEQDRKSVYL